MLDDPDVLDPSPSLQQATVAIQRREMNAVALDPTHVEIGSDCAQIDRRTMPPELLLVHLNAARDLDRLSELARLHGRRLVAAAAPRVGRSSPVGAVHATTSTSSTIERTTTLIYSPRAVIVRIIARVVEWAERRPDIRAVALVGSHARNTATPDSDVDLILLTTQPE